MGIYYMTPSMSFFKAIGTCFRKYFDFSGRARRSEYWYWYLFNILIGFVAGFISGLFSLTADSVSDAILLSNIDRIVSLLLFIPSLAVTVRRLHDIGKSGWYIFLPVLLMIMFIFLGLFMGIISFLGVIAVLIWWICVLAKDSEPGLNVWGDSLKYPEELYKEEEWEDER